jgi:hypothetical protein
MWIRILLPKLLMRIRIRNTDRKVHRHFVKKPDFLSYFYIQVSASALPVPIVEQGLRQMAVLKLTDKDLPGPARFQDGVSHTVSF